MKVLQINSVYKYGSTGKITYDIHKELLKNNIESIVCYGRLDDCKEKNVFRLYGDFYSHINHFLCNLTGISYGHCHLATHKLKNIILKEKPDIVHIQCINNYFINIYEILEWLKKQKINTVLTLHAEFMFTGSCTYALDCDKWRNEDGCKNCPIWKKVTDSYLLNRTNNMWHKLKKAYDGFDTLYVVSVSPWLKNRAVLSPMLKDKKHYVILNGLETKIFHYYEQTELINKYASNGEKIILHVTASFSDNPNNIKGGIWVIELAKKLINENIKILVVGESENIQDLPSNIEIVGLIKNQEILAQYYSMADVTLLTSKKETFSMVTAESLCCGTPVVGFKAGAPEQITIPEFSCFVDQGEIDILKDKALEIINKNFDKQEISLKAIEKYKKGKMCKDYIDLYNDILRK